MRDYQLVIQFPFNDDNAARFDALLQFEEDLEQWLTSEAEVDGNDFGSGEMNIFIRTDDPARTFECVQIALRAGSVVGDNYRAGYRRLPDETYVAIWPPGSADFRVA